MAALLLGVYVATLAPTVTFWDAGELIAAAHGLGIPHPPGTPLYVALGRAWTWALGPAVGVARAMNLLSAVCTAGACGVMAWLIAHDARREPSRARWWGALGGGWCAGLMASVWANATETEVYAVALLHIALMLAAAARAGDGMERGDRRWLLCTAYVIGLAPAVHLSALVAAPAAIVLASRRMNGRWRWTTAALLFGVLLMSAGVGRMSPLAVGLGAACVLVSSAARSGDTARTRTAAAAIALITLATSALLLLLVRARHDPTLNQGNPATLAALIDVVARRQYAIPGLYPRQAPVVWQLANVTQYMDWQIALGWGRGIVTSPVRVVATLAYVVLAAIGLRALWCDSRRVADALLVLLACGTIGVAAYLNLKAGASLGWGVLPADVPHEARERDYFFVAGFLAWGCLAGAGAQALARRRRLPAWTAVTVVLIPLAANWRASDRSRAPVALAAHHVALALLTSAPANAALFLGGDNDSYPLWYEQQVHRARPDVVLITVPLLPANWYVAEISRRTGWVARDTTPTPAATSVRERRAALIARAARAAGRPIAASPALTARERAFVGSAWTLRGVVYVAGAAADGRVAPASIDIRATQPWIARAPPLLPEGEVPVDGVARTMLALLGCPRLALEAGTASAWRDSLEVTCNVR